MNTEYCAVAAKLKAMYSRFLSEHDYEELLSKKTVRDIFVYLRSTDGYGDVLSAANEQNIHRGYMEFLLEQDVMDEYIRLYNFLDKKKRDLIEFWFMGQEIGFLKREIRYIYTHEKRTSDETGQSKFEAFFETHTKIKRNIMRNAQSLDDCIEACADTPYAEVLQRAVNINADFFTIGTMLESYRYTAVWRLAPRALSGEQLRLFREIIGTRADMTNIMWIYRGKRYYNLSKEIIFAYILSVRHHLSEDTLKQLVNADDHIKLIALVRDITPYGELFDDMDKGRFPEENYRYMFKRLSKRIFVNNSESLAAVIAYLNLKGVEFNNITSIIEGIRYNLNPDSIREHVTERGT